ncbi:MAG: membrane dipeptidase, partial [Pseudomonadota bacterium]
RNKTDEQLKHIADNGGFVGFASYPPFMAQQGDATVDDCVTTLEYIIDIAGEDSVGMGTDFTQEQDAAFFDYLSMDKGYARRLVPKRPGGVVVMPEGLRTIGDFPNLTATMEKRGWPETRIRKVMGENWLNFLEGIWGG